ncbi:MAG TPA: T9SS type A sorting domain-containing protein, partial [Cyclobacteriaceae bacterium]|nr:T9SS type A sorting domain-containing protein [Cyclobacteriaceae bacterium]
YTGTLPIQRNSFNKFWRVKLPEPIGVRDFFHIGWRQTTSALIAIGLDKNTSTAGKIFVNLNGAWEEDELTGSLMMRPVFGKGNGSDVITGIPEIKTIRAFPNPSTGVFYLAANLQHIQLLDLTGKPIAIETESAQTETKITVPAPATGIYVLRAWQGNQVYTQKIIIR